MGCLLILLVYLKLGVAFSDNERGYYSMGDEAFFSLAVTQKQISFAEPDTFLLDVAIFQATNKARRENGLPPFQNDGCLYKASSHHANAMVTRNFYGHENPYSPFEKTVLKRVDLCTKSFMRVAENIGRYQTLDSKEMLAIHWNKKTSQYEFLDPDDHSSCKPYTYEAYAFYVVNKWMSSPSHRINILNSAYTHIGCAAKLSADPFKQRKVPYASVVQSFGGEH